MRPMSIRRVVLVACLLCVGARLTAVQFSEPARLGASPDSFTAVFGTPIRSTAEIRDFQKCPGRSALAKWSVMVDGGRVLDHGFDANAPGPEDFEAIRWAGFLGNPEMLR
jgi:hypothetical protein